MVKVPQKSGTTTPLTKGSTSEGLTDKDDCRWNVGFMPRFFTTTGQSAPWSVKKKKQSQPRMRVNQKPMGNKLLVHFKGEVGCESGPDG